MIVMVGLPDSMSQNMDCATLRISGKDEYSCVSVMYVFLVL